jgi:hypothetical protein
MYYVQVVSIPGLILPDDSKGLLSGLAAWRSFFALVLTVGIAGLH